MRTCTHRVPGCAEMDPAKAARSGIRHDPGIAMAGGLESGAERGGSGLLGLRAHADPVELLAVLAGRFVDEDRESTALYLLRQTVCILTTAKDAELDGPAPGAR